MNPKDVPSETMQVPQASQADNEGNGSMSRAPQRPVFRDGMGPNDYGPAYKRYGQEEDDKAYLERVIAERKNVEEAEDVDINAGIHGNWTVENAKSKLHQFMQVNKINGDYKYTPVGPDHTRYEKKFNCQFFIFYMGGKSADQFHRGIYHTLVCKQVFVINDKLIIKLLFHYFFNKKSTKNIINVGACTKFFYFFFLSIGGVPLY